MDVTRLVKEIIRHSPRLQICPLNIFGNKPPQMVGKPDLNIGETRQGLAAWIQGQIYNPETSPQMST